MTCYEHLRKKPTDDGMYKRLQNYFKAVEENKVKEYHQKHGRK